MTWTERAFGAQTRNVAPSAIRLAPMGVFEWTWAREAGMGKSVDSGSQVEE
jgi:hypothetical protein